MPSLINERNLPTNWAIKKFKYCAQICNGGEYSDIEVEEGGYPVIGSGGEFARASKFSYYGKSVLLGRKGTVDKPLFVDGAFWCVDTMFYTKIKDFMYEKYLYYCALCFPFDYYATSTALPSMTQRDLGSQEIAVPPRKEQKAIADYLDKECAQIDSIAADLEKQIELLQQYKKSLITETVTKGLDKSVPMKDSGVEWIGKIPAHWDVEPIKFCVTFHNGDRGENYPSKSELQSEGIPFINAGHLEGDGLNMDNMDYISKEKYRIMGGVKLRSEDILYCLRGSVGKNAIVYINQGTVASSLVAIRSVRISAKYLYYCLNSHLEEVQRYLWDNGTAQPNLSADNLGKYKICIPPVEELSTIVEYLNNICSQIDNLIIGKRKQLSTIHQHKKSLIYEYVTGKKRVKEVQ